MELPSATAEPAANEIPRPMAPEMTQCWIFMSLPSFTAWAPERALPDLSRRSVAATGDFSRRGQISRNHRSRDTGEIVLPKYFLNRNFNIINHSGILTRIYRKPSEEDERRRPGAVRPACVLSDAADARSSPSSRVRANL